MAVVKTVDGPGGVEIGEVETTMVRISQRSL